jgi:hypothetical protein
MQIQMVAYRAAHITCDTPWRCVLCDKLAPIADEVVRLHMAGEHGLEAELLRQEGDALFLYPISEPTRLN